jgi:hypothetical protein
VDSAVAPPAESPAAPAAPSSPPVTEPAPAASTAPAAPTPLANPIEGEPIDLLAVTGAKGMARRLAPAIAIVLIILAAIIVFLALS